MALTTARRHRKRKLKAEINVVPYIDVMLVLLIIFMVTAPLLSVGVEVQLPDGKSSAETVKDPVTIEVAAGPRYVLIIKDSQVPREELDEEALRARIAAIVRNNPQVPVIIAGDTRADYGTVYHTIELMKEAGVTKVGLMGKQY
jgi:biopolymer transport protein TolR